MKKIKICDVVRNSVWHDPRVIKQIDEYHKNGFDLYVVGEEDNRYDDEEINKLKGIVKIVKKDKYKKFHNKFAFLLKEVYTYKSLYKALVECKPDIIHANDLNALLPAYFAAKKTKCKIIYDSHEIFTENIGIATSFLWRTFWKVVERHLIRKVDLVVCVSNAAAEHLAKMYEIEKPMVVTNCTKKQSLNDIFVKSDKFEILNHGQFYSGRGYELMIEAAKITDNKNICYVLRGFGRLEEQLKRNVIENNLTNVKFAAPVKTSELISYARSSSVGLAITLPININFKLSVSNKLFEYLAAGLPVIMSDIPEHRYLNGKYNFGIILKENTPEALKNATLLLYNDKELYKTYSENATIAVNELNWETEFKKLIDAEINLMK